MATVTGPLHSDNATGSIGKQLTFQNTAGRQTVKRYSKPTGQPSTAQVAHRAQQATLAQLWNSLTADEKATWIPLYQGTTNTAFGVFTAENWKRINAGETITRTWPPSPTTPTAATVTQTGTPGNQDVTGEYIAIDPIQNLPAYQRRDGQWTIYFAPECDAYAIGLTTDIGTEDNYYINLGGDPNAATGDYQGATNDHSGNPIQPSNAWTGTPHVTIL